MSKIHKMSSLWANASAESGILRKNDQRDKLEDLLVFGYACKLFRDDEKALEIDQGKHLIPWMGDNTLKIDRYDGRGTLSDLIPFEASKEGFDARRWLGLSESERKIEQLCDEERYYSLRANEEEDELYKEEELKRSQLQSNQFQYNYEEPPKTEGPTLPTEEDDEPFVPPPDLDVPVGMTLPSTMKQNTRIEKTALFISKEGPQMEILLKTKQSGNPQFAFLTQDDELYRYYRHILMAIKTGRYKITSENDKNEQEESKEDSHYLHPSLAADVNSLHPVPTIAPVIYKPSANCAYSQLIQRIQGNQPQTEVSPTPVAENTTSNLPSLYNHPAYIQHYQQYGYYPQYDPNYPYFAQYQEYQQNSSNPYAQIVSNLKTKDDVTTKNGFGETKTEIMKAPILYGQKSEVSDKITVGSTEKPTKTIQKPLFALAEYSDSENEASNDENDENSSALAVVVPPNDIQTIIDKMAAYVAKNGADFEAIVKSKGDQRFIFLEESHLYHPYYKYKLKENLDKSKSKTEKIDEVVNENKDETVLEKENEDKKEDEKNEKKVPVKPKEKKIITPVCFSIKKPQTTSESVTRDKSALPVEDSTDDEDQIKTDPETISSSADVLSEATNQEKEEKDVSKEENKNIIEIEDPIMELIDLTDEIEEKRDKRAEDRLKDKIAAAAREKLAEKNRALQLERKKRAAAFLSQLKPNSNSNSGNSNASKIEAIEEVKTVRQATPEPGEIISSEVYPAEDLSRLVYHIERSKSPQNEGEKNIHRSRSSSRHRHKSSHHRRKSHKRSHSHSRKRKRDRKSHERKKSKRRYHSKSKSRSKSPYRYKTDKKEDSSDTDRQKSRKKREKSLENSSYSSDYDSDTNIQK